MNEPASFKKTLLLDLSAFAAGLIAASVFGWSTRDLIWSLWISSLLSGAVFYLRGAVRIKGLNAVELALGSVSVLGGFAFFMLHFGAFHYVQGSILDLLIPLQPDPDRVYQGRLTWKGVREFSFMSSLWYTFLRYWPLVLTTIVHQFFSPPPNLKSQNESFKPYYFVLKMHVFMFPLAGLYEVGLESLPVYALVLLFFFAPASLKMVFRRTLAGRTD